MFCLKVLFFIWRDIKNPRAGGSEVFVHEIAKRWVEAGHKVTLLTAGFKTCLPRELVDGVEIIRVGSAFSVYWKAKWHYQQHLKGKFDVVVDVINTRPFMTPSFVKSGEKIVALQYQLAREYWFYELPFPIAFLGYHFLEKMWLKNYFNVPTITISNSSKQSLEEFGFKNVSIVPIGISAKSLAELPEKSNIPTLIAMSRLTKAKRVDHAIRAFEKVKEKFSNAQLLVVGDGPARKYLENMAGDGVHFFGRVSEEKKKELLKSAHVLLVPGLREGWCLVVTEANAMGTPSVGYNVPGLRDSIVDGKTGLLCEQNSEALAQTAISFLSNKNLQKKLALNALKFSRTFTWEKSAEVFLERLKRL